jgi:predicted negative regulator of RcsB-dependent stress response
MATLDLHEQEQVDAVKAWWKENGRWFTTALIVVLAGFVAVRGWQAWQGKQAQQAATLYASVIQQLGSHDAKRIGDAAQAVVDKLGSTAYAPRAQLLAAQASIEAGDGAKAKTQLQWVIDHASADGLQNVARLKLASLLLDEKKYGDALGQLDAKHPQSFNGLYDDLKGDVLLAQGKKDEARAAYQRAFDEIEEKNGYRKLVQMKLDALGGAK